MAHTTNQQYYFTLEDAKSLSAKGWKVSVLPHKKNKDLIRVTLIDPMGEKVKFKTEGDWRLYNIVYDPDIHQVVLRK